MSGEDNNAQHTEGLPTQKALEDLEERLVQRILSRVTQQDAGEGTSRQAGEYGMQGRRMILN